MNKEIQTKKEHQLIVSKPLKNGDVEMFIGARKAPMIRNAEIEEIKQQLRLAMLKVGIRANNLPSEEEKAILINHLVTNYPNITTGELRLAFELLITGKLECDAKHYENFSCLYISGVLQSYLSWAGRVYASLPHEPVKSLPNAVISDDEILRVSKEVFNNSGQFMYISEKCFDILGLKPDEQERDSIGNRVRIKLDELLKDDPNLFRDTPRERYFDMLCKKLAVADYFNKS